MVLFDAAAVVRAVLAALRFVVKIGHAGSEPARLEEPAWLRVGRAGVIGIGEEFFGTAHVEKRLFCQCDQGLVDELSLVDLVISKNTSKSRSSVKFERGF